MKKLVLSFIALGICCGYGYSNVKECGCMNSGGIGPYASHVKSYYYLSDPDGNCCSSAVPNGWGYTILRTTYGYESFNYVNVSDAMLNCCPQ